MPAGIRTVGVNKFFVLIFIYLLQIGCCAVGVGVGVEYSKANRRI